MFPLTHVLFLTLVLFSSKPKKWGCLFYNWLHSCSIVKHGPCVRFPIAVKNTGEKPPQGRFILAWDFRGFRPPWQGGQGGAEWAHGDQELDESPSLQTSSYPFVPSRLPVNGMVVVTVRMVLPPWVHLLTGLSEVCFACCPGVSQYSQAAAKQLSPSSIPHRLCKAVFESVQRELDATSWWWCALSSEAHTIHFWCFSDAVTLKIATSDCGWHKKTQLIFAYWFCM